MVPKRNKLMPWEVEALWLLAQGHRRAKVAETYRVTVSALGKLLREPAAQRELRKIHEKNLTTISEMQTELQVYAPKAMAEIVAQMEDPDVDVRFRAAKWIAEAAGHTPLRRLEVTKSVRVDEDYDSLSFEELQRRALENIKQAAIETVAVPCDPDTAEPVPALPDKEDLN